MLKLGLCSFSIFLVIGVARAASVQAPILEKAGTQQFASLDTLEQNIEGFLVLTNKVLTSKKPEVFEEFKKKYLNDFKAIVDKFYPSARSISLEIFTLMDAKQINDAVKTLVELFDKKHWFYLKNKDSELLNIELDLLLKELEIYYNFFRKTKVYKETGQLIKSNEAESSEEKALTKISLKEYFSKVLKVDTYLSLVAVRLDFLFLKMYSFALKENLQNSDLANYQQTLTKIESFLAELNDSNFERYYKAKFKLARDLIETFSANIAKQNFISGGPQW